MTTRPPQTSILVIEDDSTLNRLLVDQLRRAGYDARGVLNTADARAAVQEREPALALLDFRLPDSEGTSFLSWLCERAPVVILTAYGSIDQAVQAMQAGATEYLVKPVSPARLELAVRRALEADLLRRKVEFLETRVKGLPGAGIVGESVALQRILDLVGLVAKTDTTVLIEGESGVGKELIAARIHEQSARAKQPLVTIDCCTLQENLLESELFGHEKGAFTGADRKKQGLIEIAEGGTLFLDEIGEINPQIQAKLLRVLETSRFRRLGGTHDLTANVRFVAATNRSLRDLAAEGTFRSDLYYRLSAFSIEVPPLRERPEDILPIARHLLIQRQFKRNLPKTLGRQSEALLLAYRWPGNVRELRNAIERALIMSGDAEAIEPHHFGLPDERSPKAATFTLNFEHLPRLEELRRRYIETVLARCGGNKARAAQLMGISERNIYRLTSPAGGSGEE
jgi:DNA-binding NtrC family response regulator